MSPEILIFVFSIWFPVGDGNYSTAEVFVSEDIERSCGLNHDGCITDQGVIVGGLDWYTKRGCTVLTHEWLHLYGFSEQDIPNCMQNQWRLLHTERI